MSDARRANYAVVPFQCHLGQNEEELSVEWAKFVGNESPELEFEVPTDDPTEAYVEVQAYDVGEYGHEIVVNDGALSGFDLPPADGWQYWMDTMTGTKLVEGTNTIRVTRDVSTPDAFAIGSIVVHWKEPVE
jgi:hypothetical protein